MVADLVTAEQPPLSWSCRTGAQLSRSPWPGREAEVLQAEVWAITDVPKQPWRPDLPLLWSWAEEEERCCCHLTQLTLGRISCRT